MSLPPASAAVGAKGSVRRLSEDAYVVFCRFDRPVVLDHCRVILDSGTSIRPAVAEVLGSADRRMAIVVFRSDETPVEQVRLMPAAGSQALFEASLPKDRLLASLDLAQLSAALEPAFRTRLVRLILETAAAWLKLQSSKQFLRISQRFVASNAVPPIPVRKAIALTPKLSFVRLGPGTAQTDIESVLLVGDAGIYRNAFRPRLLRSPTGIPEIELIIERPDALGANLRSIILFTRKQVATVRFDQVDVHPLAALMPYLEGSGATALDTRNFLLKTLKPYLAGEPDLAAAFRESLQTIRVSSARSRTITPTLATGMDLAVPTPDGGLFLAGWLSDPLGLVHSIEAVSPFGDSRTMPLPRHRIRRPDMDRDPAVGERLAAEKAGFVTYADGRKEPLGGGQFSIAVKLLSGAKIDLVAPVAASTPAAARDQILASVPYRDLSPALMADCIAPAAGSLHRAHLAGKSVADEFSFGIAGKSPTWSVVIPLYKDLEFLRFQLAAFAADQDFRDAEIIFVLDSPGDRDRLERLLRSFLFIYDLPVRVLIHGGNFGYAPAVNTGVAVATGEWLVLLNSDVVPVDTRWLSRLRAAASNERRQVGITAPKLLFEDDSLQHAGLYYGRDLTGRWLNRHFYKGYPRDYAPANIRRVVPGVTGACMLVERVLYERIGGLCEDYIIADYEDSDLCLRMLDAGRVCLYEPAVELYHLERQSVAKHDGYMRTVVSDYNRTLHQQRWYGLMTEAMREFEGKTGPSVGAVRRIGSRNTAREAANGDG